MGKQKVMMLITLITGILLVTTGITYSLFTSSKISKNSSLVVGDVYMNYNETNELTIENAMPSSTFDKTKYFEFTVTGKNTTTNLVMRLKIFKFQVQILLNTILG